MIGAQQEGSAPPPSLTALRVDDSAIEIDGRLVEAPWREAAFADGFTQRDPGTGQDSAPRRGRPAIETEVGAVGLQ